MSDDSCTPTQQVSEWLTRFGAALDRADLAIAADMLSGRYEISSPEDLSIVEASRLIDELKELANSAACIPQFGSPIKMKAAQYIG